MRNKILPLIVSFSLVPIGAAAEVSFSEIMYDLPGTDTDREWVELYNSGATPLDLTGWKFDDGATSKHSLNVPPNNGGQGTMTLAPGAYAVLVANAAVFLSEHSGFSGTVIDTVMSLPNTTRTIAILNADGTVIASATYDSSMGATGDGNSLQYSGTSWLAANPTPGAATAGVSATGNTLSEQPQSAQASSSTSQASSGSTFPTEPQIFAKIRGPQSGITGADMTLYGDAWGLEKQPLPTARFLWTFGDGSMKEGRTVNHVFFLPGEYVVILEVSSDRYYAEARLSVNILPPSLSVKSIKSGVDGFVEIYNGASAELDLSNWLVHAGNKTFLLAPHTIVLPRKSLRLSNQISGLQPRDSADLLFPNGAVAASYTPGTSPAAAVSSSVAVAPVKPASQTPAPAPKSALAAVAAAIPEPTATGTTIVPAAASAITESGVVGEEGPASPWVWYGLLGGVVAIAGSAYWFLGREKQETFTIIEERRSD